MRSSGGSQRRDLDMRDGSQRRSGRRGFVRLGLAAGGVGMLAACTPAAPAPSAANPTEAPKPAAAATAAPAAAATSAPAAAAAQPTTTLKLLGWNYEPPL